MFTRRCAWAAVWCFAGLTASAPAQPGEGVRWYVNAALNTGANSGTSWTDAFQGPQGLQQAIAATQAGDEIWVAQGTYLPTNGTDRTVAFEINAPISLYGGFAGDESLLTERDIATHPTVLSGDLLRDDAPAFANRTDNSYNVVRSTSLPEGDPARLDGFLITAGNAPIATSTFASGAGLYFDGVGSGSQLVVAHCTFNDHLGLWAGACVSLRGRITLTDCRIADNMAGEEGGGLFTSSVAITLDGCQFVRNTAEKRGGGVYISSSSDNIAVMNCCFEGNQAGWDGGGLFVSFHSSPVVLLLSDCTFDGNTAVGTTFGWGGGLYYSGGAVDITRCRFRDNTAHAGGGGAYVNATNQRTILNCDFRGNQANLTDGGGILLQGAAHELVNCVFDGNIASRDGGGIFGNTSIVNCTVVGNLSGNGLGSALGGGGAYISDDTRIVNSIFWNNVDDFGTGEAAQIAMGADRPLIDFCCVQGWTGALGGAGNTGSQPLFADQDGLDDVPGNDDDDLRLLLGSPCIDSADNSALPPDDLDVDQDANVIETLPIDLAGAPRRIDDPDTPDAGLGTPPLVDMGAYEAGPVPSVAMYVGPPGGSWFVPEHWSTGQVPDDRDDVVVELAVEVDQAAAACRTLSVDPGGAVTITGSLRADSVSVLAGGALSVAGTLADLSGGSMTVAAGASLNLTGGTLHITQGCLVTSAPLEVGGTAPATLVVHEGGCVETPMLHIAQQGTGLLAGRVIGDLVNDGLLSPGEPTGLVTIEGTFSQGPTGTLRFDLAGYRSGSEYDTVQVNGAASLGGAFIVALEPEFAHRVGGVHTLLTTASSFSGDFASQTIPPLPGPSDFLLQQDPSSISLLTTIGATGPRLFVNQASPNDEDGQSWATALRHLQSALDIAEAFPGQIEEIWVAAGTYLPDKCDNPLDARSATFALVEGVSIFGGFDGTESSIDARDVDMNPTVLSGDLNGDDGPNFMNYGDNALHVVTATSGNHYALETMFDGFVIVGGNAAGLRGGGMWVSVATPTVRNCRFELNSASSGGGALRLGSGSVVEACTFIDNRAFGDGGALLVDTSFVHPVLRDCLFQRNAVLGTANGSVGGAVSIESHQSTIVNCVFEDNDCQDRFGGALWISNFATVISCVFRGNNARIAGGAIYSAAGGVIANCLFDGNTTGVGFPDGEDGGAIAIPSGPGQRIVNCTLVNNSAARSHGGIAVASGVNTLVDNCVIWNNVDGLAAGEDAQIGGDGMIMVNYSCVEGWTGALGGSGNTGLDPLFVDVVSNDYRLLLDSPCVDAGNNAAVPNDAADVNGDGVTLEPLPLDLRQSHRFIDVPFVPDTGAGAAPIVDMGAFETDVPACFCETDDQTPVDVFDLLRYLSRWFPAEASAECDGTQGVTVFDLLCFLDCWFPASQGQPCP